MVKPDSIRNELRRKAIATIRGRLGAHGSSVCRNLFQLNSAGSRPDEKGFRPGPIAFVTQEHINDLPVFISRALQIKFLLTPEAECFVDRPVPPDPPAVLADSDSQLRAKGLHPVQHRTGRDSNVTFG